MRRAALCLAVLLVALGARLSVAGEVAQRDRSVCQSMPAKAFVPSRGPAMPDDEFVRLVLTTDDGNALRRAFAKTDIDAQRGRTNTTLLALAASSGNLNAMRVLLERGAQRDKPTGSGETPLEAAVLNGQASAVCLLLQRGAKLPLPARKPYLLPAAALTEDFASAVALVAILRDHDFDPNARMNGDTALHIAAELGNVELVRLLLARGADIGQKNTRGETALSIAQRSSQPQIAQLLRAAQRTK
ncbi:ankyrin repeat domain-containing protein [Ralstonia solanacearum]|uniref:ankyrin repeat domain-containing protein n=1 Tax=Ralstonia solanacearum TaxID=305 RepID=UPI000E57A818|nr:ankyrin repeat domain-containing protein [Ralstonia solanacearum]